MGNLWFFLSLLFPLLLPSKWKGSRIWQHICNKKVHFTSKKLPLTLIQSEPRQRVNHKAYQYPAVFGQKQEELDQLHLRKVPSVYSTCFKMIFFKLFIILFRDTVDNCILDFTPRMLYKFSWLPAFWELFLEALTSLLLTLHVASSK